MDKYNFFTVSKRRKSSSHWGSGLNMGSWRGSYTETTMRRDSKGERVGRHDAQHCARYERRKVDWGHMRSSSRVLGGSGRNADFGESLMEMESDIKVTFA